MSIPGQQSINVGLPNESINSDSLYTAFTKTQENFDTLFTCASPFTNFVASTGIGVSSNANSGTVTIENTGVTSIIAGTNIVINRSNGNVTISATGGGNGGGGITSVGLLPGNTSRLVVTNSPLVAAGNIGIDLATTGITEGTYTNPNLTVDPYGRVVGITNGPAVGTVTSVGLTQGPGIQVNGGPIQSSGNIIVTNTGVIRLTAGSGIDLSGSNGNVTVSLAGGGVGSVTSVGIYSTSLSVSGSPITTAGNIRIELPPNPSTSGTFAAGNLTSSGTLVVTGNANVGNIGGTEAVFTSNVSAGNIYANSGAIVASTVTGSLTTAAQPNITSVGTLTSLAVAGNVTSGNANLGNAVTANFFIGSGANLSAIQGANVAGTVANAANSLRVATTAQTTGIYYVPFVSATPTANYGLNSNSAFVANIANGTLSAPLFNGVLTSSAQPNITSFGTLTALNVSGLTAITGAVNVTGALSVTANANVGNIGATNGVFTNVSGNGSALSSITGANVTGQVGNALIAGTVYTAAQPNITSVGTLSGLAVSGNVNFTGPNVTLGQVGNVKILGGTANAILRTDGTGNLSWTTPTTSYVHTQSSASTTWVVTHNLGVQYVNVQVIDSTGNSFTGRYNYPTITFNNTSALTVTFDSAQAGYAAVTSGGGAQGPQGNPGAAGAGAISNGVSNVSILTSGGNVTVGVGGTANVATFTQTGINVAGTLNATGNANVGNIGATNGVFTNVSGNGSALSSITGANVTGTVPLATSATTAGTVTTAAQPNITSVGTLSSLTVTGKVTAGQLQGEGGNISNVQAANISGTVSSATSATTAGTVTTAAQPNITSVGTLANLNVSGNVSFTGANISLGSNANVKLTGGTGGQLLSTDGAGNLSWVNQGSVIGGAAGSNTQIQYNAMNLLAGSANFTFNYLTNVLNVNGNIASNGTIGGAGATLFGTTLTTGANTTAGNITGNWTLTAGSRLTATYADLAEYYEADDIYSWGNVVEFGGEKEITLASKETTKVAGVVSKNPAYVMNATCPGLLTAIALQGRVPCRVIGPVSKGDMMVSAGAGYAKACASPSLGSVIGKSLENFSGTEGLIEIVVGRL